MNVELIDTTFMFLVSIADKLAETMKLQETDSQQLIFEYHDVHYVLHSYNDKWNISYPEQDKYWFDYIEDHPPKRLNYTIDSFLIK